MAGTLTDEQVKELAKKVCCITGQPVSGGGTFPPLSGLSIIAAGPILKAPGCDPTRVVWRIVGDEFVIHHQVWRDRYVYPDGSLALDQDSTTGYERGVYIPVNRPGSALRCFIRAVVEHVGLNWPLDESEWPNIEG